MVKVKARRFAMLGWSTVFYALLCPAALAQVGNGDYDGDFDVDGQDFVNWAGCMTGLDGGWVSPFSSCAAFDLNGDNDVDLEDFGAFQLAFQKPPPQGCTPEDPEIAPRFWVGARTPIPTGVIGALSHITGHPNIQLCQGNPEPPFTFSAVAIDISRFTPSRMFAQMGYMYYRQPGITLKAIYCETMTGSEEGQYDRVAINADPPLPPGFSPPPLGNVPDVPPFTGLPTVTLGYWFRKLGPAPAGWNYHLGDSYLAHIAWLPEWGGLMGTQVSHFGELVHKESDLVGKVYDVCKFRQIQHLDHNNDWISTVLNESINSDNSEWGVVMQPHSLDIWDRTPLPPP